MLLHSVLCRSWQRLTTSAQVHRCTLQHALSHTSHPPRPQVRSFRSSKSHASKIKPDPLEAHVESGTIPQGNLVKALVFTGAFSLGCFAGATIMEYENTRSMILAKAKQTRFAWWQHKQNNVDKDSWAQFKNQFTRGWDQLTPGEKVFVPLCALNLIVFAMWRVPSMRNTMLTYFTSNPSARIICWPMFLSTFSHYSAMHIFANMYVLHSFSNAAVMSLGKEQFLAVYLSAGVVSSLASVFYKALTTQAGVSLGASGAIMAILAYVCSQYPDTQLGILFLPTLTFSASSAIKVIMGIDFAGCVLGWKFFDHAAHLGGALFGILWAYYGTQLWAKRITLLNYYHDLRKTKPK